MKIEFDIEKFLDELCALCKKYGVQNIHANSDEEIVISTGREWFEFFRYGDGEIQYLKTNRVDDCYSPTKEE